MPDIDTTAVSGVEARGYRRGGASTDGWDQYVVPVKDRVVTWEGRASSFRTTGRAAATQNLMSIYNASSTTIVSVNRIMFDMYGTAARLITVPPAIVRVSRFTTAPTNGTTLTPAAMDTALTQDNTNVTVRGDASADGANSGTTLTVTIPAGSSLTQEVCPRSVWTSGTVPAAGTWTELADRLEFFVGQPDIILRQNQGVVVHLASPGATSIPNTDFFITTIDWEEFTRP